MDLIWVGRIAAAAYVVVLALLCVYGLHRYFLVLLYYAVRRSAAPRGGRFDDLPAVTIQLPMYNERHVARRVIEAACAVDYPSDRLEIQVLDDSTDETREIVRDCARRMRAAGHNVVLLQRERRTGYKAGALEAGMRAARGAFIAIFDADFVPPPNILRDTIHHFTDERVGMVQCRWDHLNRGHSLLTRAQAVLLDGHFVIEHTARNRTGRFMSFNGTAGVWRKAAIEDAGGWQHDTLTEDLDLSYRAQLRGWRFVFRPDLAAPAELPPEMNAFKAQQHRWAKGGAQTCVKMLPSVLAQPCGWRVKLEAVFHLSSGLVYILMVLLSLLLGPALLYKLLVHDAHEHPWRLALDFTLFFIGTGSALSFYIVSQRGLARSWAQTLRTVPPLMAIGVGIAFNNALAAIEGFFSKSGEFVRTPKFGDAEWAGSDGPDQGGAAASARTAGSTARDVPLSPPARSADSAWLRDGAWKGWVELAIAAYMAACLVSLFFFEEWVQRVSAAIPFLGLFIFGYAYVAATSLYGRWRPRTAQRTWPQREPSGMSVAGARGVR